MDVFWTSLSFNTIHPKNEPYCPSISTPNLDDYNEYGLGRVQKSVEIYDKSTSQFSKKILGSQPPHLSTSPPPLSSTYMYSIPHFKQYRVFPDLLHSTLITQPK